MTEAMYTLIDENVKPKNLQTHMMGHYEKSKSKNTKNRERRIKHLKGSKNVLNKIIKENLSRKSFLP